MDVVKLIAQGTIEEKVTDLSKRKRAVFDRVVMAGETELRSLSEEDIRALFFQLKTVCARPVLAGHSIFIVLEESEYVD